ncbi:organic cation transporter protein-like [Sitodiplosis mosellana]|uniref:organic cation transporter protein-like n=1 Tax=Sitodiplosis mosellana TaxID=263140 RepID=UPI002444A5FF|nr:organic cation transporter protein-like [Sitodiplosis mosellana]
MSANSNLDAVLTEVGEFGLFQVITYMLICIPSALSATYVVNYMVSANTLIYRCKIPECDVGENSREIAYDQPWLRNAIPTIENSNGKMENCVRYASLDRNSSTESSLAKCGPDMFNKSLIVKCSEFIYATDERNVQTELNIHCADSYKLALVGTVNNIGRFVFLPLNGLLSDKYGRLTVVIIGMTCGSLFGLIKSFSTNYLMYICLEFFESMGTSCFAGMYVLALEWVNSRKRVLGSVIVAISFPVGEILLGLVAMYVHDFRTVIRILYTPGLFLVVYFYIVPESVRWLLVSGRVERAIQILKRTARVNGKTLSDKSIEMIKMTYKPNPSDGETTESNSIAQSLKSIFKSKVLFFRFLNNCYQWMNCCFCYYGLSLIATQLPGENRYTSFIFVVAIEIPGLLIALPLLNRINRRILLFGALSVTAFSTIVTSLIPAENSTVILLLFMLGKCTITLAFNSLYVFTAEQWPTNVRTTIINACSMIGRIGSMLAPSIVLLAQHGSLPSILFGASAILAAFLVLLCPETFSKKLPDTVEEAKALRL